MPSALEIQLPGTTCPPYALGSRLSPLASRLSSLVSRLSSLVSRLSSLVSRLSSLIMRHLSTALTAALAVCGVAASNWFPGTKAGESSSLAANLFGQSC